MSMKICLGTREGWESFQQLEAKIIWGGGFGLTGQRITRSLHQGTLRYA